MRYLPLIWVATLALLCGSCGSPATTPGLSGAAGGGDDASAGQDSAAAPKDTATAGPKDAAGDTAPADAKTDAKTDASGDAKADAATVKADAKTDSATGSDVTAPNVVCGDKFCGEGEDCLQCPYDCGPCAASCGDTQCGPTETCSSCPADCGQCANACPNGACEPQESCANCPADCGKCPGSCGDGTCNPGEDCDGCPADCGKCSNEPCNPFGSQGCKDWEQCFPYSGGDLVCLGAGSIAKGGACKYLPDCQKGLICVNSTCNEICDVTGKSGWKCPAGKQCSQMGQSGKPSAAAGACL